MLKATDAREMFGEHDRSERVARAAAESNSSAPELNIRTAKT